ncbi:MAG: AAA family ATPase [Gammaproteobacteria bacterium]
MRSIMVLNAKGGCGKSTLATSLASYYAAKGLPTVLADFDPQGSSMSWLAERSPERPEIQGIRAWEDDLRVPKDIERLIIDAPARIHGKELKEFVKRAQTIIIPVLPSPIDIRAAAGFIDDLLSVGKISRGETKVAVVANRVRESTLAFQSLNEFLSGVGIPFIAILRDSQNYVKAAERGLGIFELPPYMAEHDVEQWEPLIRWLNSKRSMPA